MNMYQQVWDRCAWALGQKSRSPSSAMALPLAAPSCYTWAVILCVPLLKYSLSIKDDITSAHPEKKGE